MGIKDDKAPWEEPLDKAPWDFPEYSNWGPGRLDYPKQQCLHKGCTDCHGTGKKKNGEACIHFISCPCPQCTIMV